MSAEQNPNPSTLAKFVHLGLRSEYSAGDSLARLERLCSVAVEDGQPAATLCDRMTLAGAPAFAALARRRGIRALFGLEANVLPMGERMLGAELYRVRLLAADAHGWRRLVRLVNLGQTRVSDGIPPWLRWEEILAEPAGLLYLVGGIHGEATRLSARIDLPRLDEHVRTIVDAVGTDRLFVALPAPTTTEGLKAVRALWNVAEEHLLAPVAVPEVHYALSAQDAAWQLLKPRVFPDPPVQAATFGDLLRSARETNHVLSTAQASDLYRDLSPAVENASRVAALCKFEFPVLKRRFPVMSFDRGVDADSCLWNEVFTRATARYGAKETAPWRERLNREFRDIVEAGLADALLCRMDLDRALAADEILRGPDLGVLNNSLMAHLLDLTPADPLAMDHPFVIHDARAAMVPVLEVAVPQRRLADAVRVLSDMFRGHVARLGRWHRWNATAALELLLERLGLNPADAPRMTKEAPWRVGTDRAAIDPKGMQIDLETPLTEPAVLAWLASHIEGRVREMKPVPNSFAFSVDSLADTLPCGNPADLPAMAQWDTEACEAAGLGRVVFTTEPALNLIDETLEWARNEGLPTPDPIRAAGSDDKTLTLLREGATQGLMLLASPGVRIRLRGTKLNSLADVYHTLKIQEERLPPTQPDAPSVVLACAAAYVKAHYPVAFMAAALTRAAGDVGEVAALLFEAQHRGIDFMPLDINCSSWAWMPERGYLRPGLVVVRGMPPASVEELLRVRTEGPFQGIADILRRTDTRVTKLQHIEALIDAGALDSMGQPRHHMRGEIARIAEILGKRGGAAAGEDPLQFFGLDTQWWLDNGVETPPPSEPETDEQIAESATREREVTGLLLSFDADSLEAPFRKAARAIAPQAVTSRHAGCIVTLVSPICALESLPGYEPRAALADMGGVAVLLRGAQADAAESLRANGEMIVVAGLLERDGARWSMRAERLDTVERAARRAEATEAIEIHAGRLSHAQGKELLALVKQYPGPSIIRLMGMPVRAERVLAKLSTRRVTLCPDLEIGLSHILGTNNWCAFVSGTRMAQSEEHHDDIASSAAN
jgi:DNA polymerase III alpha subunit